MLTVQTQLHNMIEDFYSIDDFSNIVGAINKQNSLLDKKFYQKVNSYTSRENTITPIK